MVCIIWMPTPCAWGETLRSECGSWSFGPPPKKPASCNQPLKFPIPAFPADWGASLIWDDLGWLDGRLEESKIAGKWTTTWIVRSISNFRFILSIVLCPYWKGFRLLCQEQADESQAQVMMAMLSSVMPDSFLPKLRVSMKNSSCAGIHSGKLT